MANSVVVNVAGLQQLGEAMRELKAAVAQRIGARAVGLGAVVIQKQAIENAPLWPETHKLEGVIVPSGNLKANIVKKKIKSELTIEYIVTVRGKRKDFFAARYGRLVEHGTVHMRAQSFMRKAFETEKQKAADTIINELANGVQKQVNKGEALGQSLRDDLGI